MKAKKIIILILIFLLLGVGGYSGYRVYKIQSDYNASENEYEILSTEYVKPVEIKPEDPAEEPQVEFSIDYEGLKAKNGDFQGWMVAEGIKVNLPVMRTNNNDYYLHRTFEGEWRFAGSLFIDYRFQGLDDPYIIIYGHNMKNNTMFGRLANYRNEDFYKQWPTIKIYENGRVFNYDVFSFFDTTTDSKVYTYAFADKAALKDQFNWLKSKSYWHTDVEFNEWDKIIVLSTCMHSTGNQRWVLAAKLSSIEYLDNIVNN